MKIFGNLIGFSYNYTVLPQESLDPPKKGVGFSKPPVTWEAYTIFEKGVRLLYSILDFIDWFSLRWFNQPFFLWNIRSVVKLAILSVYLSINLDNISDLSCHKTFDYVHFIMDNMSLFISYVYPNCRAVIPNSFREIPVSQNDDQICIFD